MAVKLRLTRVGSKKNPIYRVVAADSRSPRDGRFLEIVGRYNPQTEPSLIELDDAKVKSWLDKGAQPTEAVARLIKVKGISPLPPMIVAGSFIGRRRGKWLAPHGEKRTPSRFPRHSNQPAGDVRMGERADFG